MQFVPSPNKTVKMLLAADIGNTRVKYAIFLKDNLESVYSSTAQTHEQVIAQIFTAYPRLEHVVLSSVKGNQEQLPFPIGVKIHQVSALWHFPFTNQYQTPGTLGIDRMILAAGAVMQFPNQCRLVIDAGSCITYDVIDAQNQYLGGAISPGIEMRYRSMHDFTAQLPLLPPQLPAQVIGNSTAESMHSGVCSAVCFEIEGFMANTAKIDPNFITILTGGDALFLASRLKNTIFAHSNFLLESMQALYNYNQA